MSTYLEGYLIGVCLMGMLGELKSPNENASGKILLAILWPVCLVAISVGTVIQVVRIIIRGDHEDRD